MGLKPLFGRASHNDTSPEFSIEDRNK